MKPEIYATKKAIAPITIAMVIMIRSRLSSGNMTQDGGISLEYTVPCRAPSKGTSLTSPLVIGYCMSGFFVRMSSAEGAHQKAQNKANHD